MAKHTRRFDPHAPNLEPPEARTQLYAVRGGTGGTAGPAPLSETYTEGSAARVIAPTLTPPGEVEAAAAEEAVTVWLNNKKIEALWSDSTNLNSWIAIPGSGWKKLFNGTESALVSMSLIAAHAEQTSATVNVRIEADDLVHEIYVW